MKGMVKNMKKYISLILIVSLISLFAGCGKKEQEAEPVDAAAVNVTVYDAAVGNISNMVTYTGEIKASESVAVSPKVSGKVVSVYVEEGQYVNAGDVLFKIDDTDLKLQYNQAQAAYNTARVGYDNTKNSTTKQTTMQVEQALKNAQDNYDRQKQLYDNNSTVKVAETAFANAKDAYESAQQNYENNLVSAKNALSTAETNYNNTKSLFEAGGATQTALDAAKSGYENAQAAYETLESNQKLALENSKAAMQQAEENLKTVNINARASLDSAELALKNAQESYDLTVNVTNNASTKSAAASLESASAALSLARNALNNATVKAPISGFVSSKTATAGQMVSAGMTAVTIHNTNSVDGEVHVTESVISSLQIGTPATVTVKSAGAENMPGTISLLNQVKDPQTGMFTVKVNIPNADNILKAGMFADITLQTSAVSDVLCIPSKAIMQEGEERYVYVTDGATAQKRTITEGVTNGTVTEIISGINEGDKIVLKGMDYITEKNNKVRIVED